MKFFDLTTTLSEDGEQILSVSGRIANHPLSAEQTEWISFQFAVNLPTVRNGALQRQAVLEKVRDIAQQLANDFGKIAEKKSSSTQGRLD